jgi:hypothetical protein
MNLNLDLSVVTRLLRATLNELRQKRLWPVAALLLAGIVAVPVLLTKSPKPTPVAQAPVTPPPPSGTTLPAINVQSTPAHTNLKGKSHNPFAAAAGSGGSSSPTTSTASGAVSTASGAAQNALNALTGAGSATSSGASSTFSSGAGATTPSSAPPSITGNAKPKPAPSGLTSNQAYDVALSITNGNGVDAVDPLERLSVLPNQQQPLLVELGVLKGGKRVLFAVQPGTVVNGPGTCTPGPIDCEILSLGQDQTESVSTHTSTVALFAITGISATNYSSAAAATRARQAESEAGEALLDNSSLPALSLFKYEPSVGSVVDLRNLRVGG